VHTVVPAIDHSAPRRNTNSRNPCNTDTRHKVHLFLRQVSMAVYLIVIGYGY